MNKIELVAAMAESANLKKAEAGAALEALLDIVTSTLKAGEEVRLVGFGTFTTTRRDAGTARNPRTGEEIKTKASVTPKFKPATAFKAALNEGVGSRE